MQHLGDGYGFKHNLEIDPDMRVTVGIVSPLTDYCRRQTPWPKGGAAVFMGNPGRDGWVRARFDPEPEPEDRDGGHGDDR